jgi:exodeoxyribonuclease V gamma subunit
MSLKDQILGWLNDNPDMELRDIVVMAPDIQDYAAIIPAVFHDIQHSIADRSLRHQNRALPLFFQFLDLAGSRCSWSGVLDLLEKPEIASNFGDLTESDIELIRHWVTNAGIRFGLSSDQLQTMNLELAEITWQAGLERLLLGYAMDWEQPVDGVLPYPDIEGSQARPLGGVCQFVELLLKAAEDLRISRPLTAWSTLLRDYLESLFGSDREDNLARVREILTDLALGFGSFHHHDVPLEVIRAWLETTASESRTSAGFLRGHLTFCSMLPMRSIPFRAICLLGLNDGVFPKTDRRPPFDLLGESFRAGDRSRRRDDRYQFLEVLLSARQYLYLSHVGQSILSGRDIPPSVLISELVETLKLSYGIKDPVRKHPLQPFSSRYFSGTGMFSFNGHNCEVAKILSHPTPPAHTAPWWSGNLPQDDTNTVNTADLLSFFAHPQKWFVRNRLAIRLDTDKDLPEENELFSVGGLEGYQVNQDIIQTFLETGAGATAGQGRSSAAGARDGAGATAEPGPILARLRAQGRWMLGAPGQLAFDRLIPELHDFASTIQAQNLGLKLPDLPIDLTAAGWRLTGQLTGIHENGILLARYTECKGKDLLKAWIHHLLANTLTPTTTMLLSRDRTLSFAPPADPFRELIRLLAVFRQGAVSPSPLHVESAWSYIQQQEKNVRANTSPLQAAIKTLKDSLDNGYEPELALLYGDCDPVALLGPEFQQLCEEFIRPIFLAGRANS